MIAQPEGTEPAYPGQVGAEVSPVSEELLHRAIRSNVELAEALGQVVRDLGQGLATIHAQADQLTLAREDASRGAATADIQREVRRLQLVLRDVGQAASAGRAASPGRAPAPPQVPPTPPRGTTAAPAPPPRTPPPPPPAAAGRAATRGSVARSGRVRDSPTPAPPPPPPVRPLAASVAQHELEAADLALDVGGRRVARGVRARERQLVGLRLDGGEALAQVVDDLSEGFRELDIRADRAVEKLLGDGADIRTDLGRGRPAPAPRAGR